MAISEVPVNVPIADDKGYTSTAWARWLQTLRRIALLRTWSPVFAVKADGARRVLQVADWTGGTGGKPETGYVGSDGLVPDVADGVDISG